MKHVKAALDDFAHMLTFCKFMSCIGFCFIVMFDVILLYFKVTKCVLLKVPSQRQGKVHVVCISEREGVQVLLTVKKGSHPDAGFS